MTGADRVGIFYTHQAGGDPLPLRWSPNEDEPAAQLPPGTSVEAQISCSTADVQWASIASCERVRLRIAADDDVWLRVGEAE